MGRRGYRDAGRIHSQTHPPAGLVDGGEAPGEISQRGQIQVDMIGAGGFHLLEDRPGHHITGGQIFQWMMAPHERASQRIQQHRAFAAQGLGSQEKRAVARIANREGGGMELEELQVSQQRPGAPGDRHAVTGDGDRVSGA